ncbi:DNA-directed RNA polymerase I subunit RPA12 [Golovinomyces cichoracearum]|uniref:DNA-directed RNA polymerase I subunit RPA12 n=1 Tax=Golovinomyces cichoracearum TaxID=62708 RepID=A0A420IBP1_9PEZI|nr:DNA-directed RNA polymerase I subunit RPA12 [Golovinomyces cichoracearum]
MAPNFCRDCGNILDISAELIINCECCGKENQSLHNFPYFILPSNSTIDSKRFDTTTSKTNNFPSLLREKLTSKTQQLTSKDFENTRVIERECPECQAKVMTWSEAQMRSADEGSTIFYRCVCGYRFNKLSTQINPDKIGRVV